MKNTNILLFIAVMISVVALVVSFTESSPQLAPSTFSIEEQQGQVILMGTPGVSPDRDPLLRTNYFSTGAGQVSRIAYVKPDFTNIQSTPAQRACFGMTYLDRNKVVMNTTGLGVATSLCLNEGDNGFVLEVLQIAPLTNSTGRVVVTAPQIP